MLNLYFLLGTNSRRAMAKRWKRGKGGTVWQPYRYNPRGSLLQRLSVQTGLSIEAVYRQLLAEREILLKESEPIAKAYRQKFGKK